MKPTTRIVIGNVAVHHFHGHSDLEVVRHARRGQLRGYFHIRKRLRDRAAYKMDATWGWEVDRWFEWRDEDARE